jgi:hypothetical protein
MGASPLIAFVMPVVVVLFAGMGATGAAPAGHVAAMKRRVNL